MTKPLMVPATEQGIKTLAALVGRFLPRVTMTGARVTSLSPVKAQEDGAATDSVIENWTTAPVSIGQAAVVLRQGSFRVMLPLNPTTGA